MKKLAGILVAIIIWNISLVSAAAQTLIPVGAVVGLELENDTVTIAAFEEGSQAKAAGLQVGDRLLSLDGSVINCAEDVRKALERSDGTVEIVALRQDKTLRLSVSPQITQSGPKLGVYLKEGVTGIGTVTFYDPETGLFGTLGHGVNDPDGALLNLTGGNAYRARIASVRKGKCGEPGQLVGALTQREPIGRLYRNSAQGVFGKTELPMQGEALPVGTAENVQTGPATILSTVAGETPREYSVEIVKVYSAQRSGGRNMLLRITDPTLLETTGGIVQGMGVSYNRDNQVNP